MKEISERRERRWKHCPLAETRERKSATRSVGGQWHCPVKEREREREKEKEVNLQIMKSSHELHYEWYISIVKLRTYYFTHNLSLRQTKLCHPQHCFQLTHLVPHLQAVWKQEQSDSFVCTVSNTYLMSALLSRMYADHTCSTNTNVFSTRTFIGVRRSGLRRSCTLCSLVWARFTFSFWVYYIHVCIYVYTLKLCIAPSPSLRGSFSCWTLG